MKTSAAGRALITQREGCRLTAYRDSKSIPTIGVGHVNMTPPVTRMGMTITAAQADAMLAADLAPVEAVINGTVKVPLSQNEFDALVSLGFNIGAAGLKRSSVVKKLNLGDVKGAAEAFMAWSKPAVLMARRREEKTQFLAPDRDAAGGTLPAIAPARAATLSTRAEAAKAHARAAQSAGAVAVVTGATIATTVQSHHLTALGFAAFALAIGVCAALFAVQRQSTARTLTLNAERGMPIEPLEPSGVALVQSLKQ